MMDKAINADGTGTPKTEEDKVMGFDSW